MALDFNINLPKPQGNLEEWARRFAFDVEDRLRRIGVQVQRVRKNSTGTVVGPKTLFNFIEGSNITLTVADDNINDEVDITIASSVGGGGDADTLDGLDSTAFALVGHLHSHASLTGIGVNDHHNQSHVLATTAGLGADHTTSGLTAGQVLRASGATTAAFAQLAHSDLGGIGANDHHNQSHVLATNVGLGVDHTMSGATAGHVLRASSATAAAFAQLQHTDLGSVGANDHHAQSHVLATGTALGPDHTISGAAAGEVLRALGATTAAFDVLQHTDLGGVGANDHHNQSHVLATSSALGPDHTVSGLTTGHVLTALSATTAAFQAVAAPAAHDHGSSFHTGLTDDDHTQYLLLAGRAGTANNALLSTDADGTITGSAASGGSLSLRSTTSGTKGLIAFGAAADSAYNELTERLGLGITAPSQKLHVVGSALVTEFIGGGTAAADTLDLRASTATDYTGRVDIGKGAGDYNLTDPVCLELWPDGLTYGAVALLNAIRMISTMTQKTNASFALPFINLFRDAHQHVGASSSVTDYNADNSFAATPIILNNTTAAALAAFVGLLCQPDLQETSTGSLSVGVTGVQTQIRRGAGTTTASTYKALNILGGVGAGTLSITDFIGVDVADMSPVPGGINAPWRSVGLSGQMRHAGQAMFGATGAPDTTNGNIMEIARTHTLGASIGDGQAAGLVLDPGYTGAFTVTRHNYLKYEDVSVAASAVVTDSCIAWFDAAAGTHKAVTAHTGAGSPTLHTAGNAPVTGDPDAWIKVNVNGTMMRFPVWA